MGTDEGRRVGGLDPVVVKFALTALLVLAAFSVFYCSVCKGGVCTGREPVRVWWT